MPWAEMRPRPGSPVSTSRRSRSLSGPSAARWPASAAWSWLPVCHSGQPSTGEGYETDAIAAAVLGGTSFFGGTGSVGGLLIGVLIIGVISNGLNLMHVNSYWQFVLKGIIIIAAVYFDMVKQKRQNTAK